ncbi:glycosyl transferase [Pseudoxanthomonas kaohsiungensis]|uniref:Glycosyl transferase n=1 Tax=Pseudoxanthomonas kaohsiungensis TaxID=283923 RepID=A0ABW3LTV6_9GAMM|nr:glycosyl transferase [Pseudoxanthomonas kaohsiungensis]
MAAWLMLLAGVSAAGTWLALVYARRHKLIDQPGERRSHSVPTPRGGGIGIAFALLVGCAMAAATGMAGLVSLLGFATGLLLVAGIGWVDDHRPLGPVLRLLVQCLAGLVLAWGLHGAEGRWGWVVLTALSVPVLVNVWNFMDGINGLASSQAVLAAAAVGWLVPPVAYPALALAAATAAFVPFNFPKARIFLGDVGSGTLGYALAALLALAARDASAQKIPDALVLVLPLSAFLIDASLTLGARMLAGEVWWQPHTSHLYQCWVKAGRSHTFVTLVYAAFSVVAVILASYLSGVAPWFAGGGVALWLSIALLAWVRLRRRLVPGKGTERQA